MKNDENKKKQSIRNVVDRMTQWVVAKFGAPLLRFDSPQE